ncbi:TOMM precursor leader peptide-binding protein [Paracoccus salsus]|uniref:TOMM precursor leader peptide-binding protein n=1 Tax=Paracoccus salsus TaxID=2911061 RepID=UPI001F303AAA|nr:TOMM precursor leader peptide-binding protein [Paracoccus salsus]MCF3974289.1 TOMM precursor leader peptide-binding protein [Paracoccus salsus]
MPSHFLTWLEPPGDSGDEVLRVVSWRRSVTLKGHSFREFNREVVPLLDGRHDLDSICDEVSDIFDRDDLVAALDMLAAQGIVVEAAAEDADAPAGALPQLGWLAEAAPEGRAAQRHLSQARIVLFGCGGPGATAARNLVAAGVGDLLIVDPADLSAADAYFSPLYGRDDIGKPRAEVLAAALGAHAPDARITAKTGRPEDSATIAGLLEGATLALCCLESAELNLALKLNRACRDLGLRWLAGSLEGLDLVVGPGFSGDRDAPCYMCWRMREVACAGNPQARFALERHLDRLRRDLSGRRENLSVGADIVGGMMAAEVITVLTGAGPPALDGRVLVIEMPGLRQERHTLLRKPGCPVCGAGP